MRALIPIKQIIPLYVEVTGISLNVIQDTFKDVYGIKKIGQCVFIQIGYINTFEKQSINTKFLSIANLVEK